MNRSEIEQLAGAVNRLRPDWRYDSLVTFLTKHAADRPLWDAARAMVWIAVEPGTEPGTFDHQTPRLFTTDGPWWSQQVLISPRAEAPTPIPLGWCSLHRCEDSQRQPCTACRQAAAQAITDPARIAEIRAQIRAESAKTTDFTPLVETGIDA